MKRIFLLIIFFALAIPGCLGGQMVKPDLHGSVYAMATSENKERISQGRLGIGMSLPECRAAWPNSYFYKVSQHVGGTVIYETWKVQHIDDKIGDSWLYLNLEGGKIISITQVKKYGR